MSNLLIHTDVYKIGHMKQYPKGTTKVYSYLQARCNKLWTAEHLQDSDIIFYGLQYFVKKYLKCPTEEDVEEFLLYAESILGPGIVDSEPYYKLAQLGYLPLEIKAIPEGTKIGVNNALVTITNTHPDFYWLVGFVESLLLKTWNTTAVATNSFNLYRIINNYSRRTDDNQDLIPFQIHDFGYRGCSSEETAALSGSAHLLSFKGTDTVPAVKLLKDFYNAQFREGIGLSVPASEHSVMCAYGKENEIQAFEHMLNTYPKGIVSIVSDTYDLWNVLNNFTDKLKDDILNRDGKVVFRPDSGHPVVVIYKALNILWDKFGGTINSKGFKVLNPKVGLIYGDGIYPQRMNAILSMLEGMGFATCNIVFGVGGLLLQQFNRDDLGFAVKATYCEVNGKKVQIFKDPVTDPGKKSHKGKLKVIKTKDGFETIDNIEDDSDTALELVCKDICFISNSLNEIRKRVKRNLAKC